MVYVALLRGINVGGNSKVSMSALKQTFSELKFSNVSTYINSGNVVFCTAEQSCVVLAELIEAEIEKNFGFAVPVLVISFGAILSIESNIPANWVNDANMKTDVMFLWNSVDSEDVINELEYDPELEKVLYSSGAIIWNVTRENVSRSAIRKLIGTALYKQMTIRNVNTVRKLVGIMGEIDSSS